MNNYVYTVIREKNVLLVPLGHAYLGKVSLPWLSWHFLAFSG